MVRGGINGPPLSQRTLPGVSRQTVNAIETGRYEASLSLAFAIARLFRKRVDEIFSP
jgi:DNA-binding XRE family transcriptional regulator